MPRNQNELLLYNAIEEAIRHQLATSKLKDVPRGAAQEVIEQLHRAGLTVTSTVVVTFTRAEED